MNKIQAMELASGLTRLITGMEDELLQNIAAYLLAGKVDSSTSKWKIRKLAELGKLHQKNIETITSYAKEQREIAELTVKLAAVDAMQDTERGFRKAVIAGLVTDAADGTMDSTMNAIIGTLTKQAKNDLNIVNTTMLYKARDAAGKAVRDAAQLANKQEFVDMLNKAAGQVVTNTETMTAAVSKCLKDMANKGIPAFVDRGGREWSPEAYVGLCVRQTAMNTGTTALFERMKDYHTHFIEISSHLGARPKCSRDQGRIFDLDNTSGYIEDGHGNIIEYSPWSSSSYGQPDGILGINCKHSAFPFTPGSSLQTYFPYDREENDKRYKEIQKQRELERNVRAAKRECAMLKNGDPEQFKKASVRLKDRTAQLKQYCNEHDLTYMNERTSVLGYGHSEASKVTAAYRKALEDEELKLHFFSLDNYEESDIMKMKGKLDDREARMWYKDQDKKIPNMIDRSLPIEEQARQACDLRNKFRTQTRDMMSNQELRRQLDITDPNKSFDELIADKMVRKGLSREEAVKDILKTATKTRKSVDTKFGLE